MAHERHSELVVMGREIVQNAPQLFVDLVVESDGWPGYGSLLSIGAVSPWGETFYRELRPGDGPYIPDNREFCAKHGLTYERLTDEGIEPGVALRELTEWQSDIKDRYGKIGKSINEPDKLDLALSLIEKAKAGETPRERHVGAYLPGDGRRRRSLEGNWREEL